MSYAVIKTGGKQYRVEEGQTLLVERLPAEAGTTVGLEPLLFRGEDDLRHGDELAKVTVQATVLGHERGPKVRVLKFKPKRGYKRRTGHRQELTRLEVTAIKAPATKAAGAKAAGDRGAKAAGATAATSKQAE